MSREYNDWIEDHESDLKDQWDSMNDAEMEDGYTFEKFCLEQYDQRFSE